MSERCVCHWQNELFGGCQMQDFAAAIAAELKERLGACQSVVFVTGKMSYLAVAKYNILQLPTLLN